MNLCFIDFETYFDKKAGYDLRSMSMVEFLRDPRFKVEGYAWCAPDTEPRWETNADELKDGLWSDIAIVGHNLKFDGSILALLGLPPAGRYIDTKALCRAVLGKQVEGYSLAELAAFFGLPPKKDMPEDDPAALAEYCKHDVWLCRELYKRTIDFFPENQLPHLDWTIRSFVYPKLVIDTAVAEAAVVEEKERKAKVFADIGVDKAVFSSNQKFAELLTQKGYTPPTKKSPRTGLEIPALALGDTAFLDMLESEDKTLRALCEARSEAKSTIMETRCAKLAAVGRSGPWPFDVEFSGAAQTHRYSGGGSAGGNPQNFVRGSALRAAILAPPGFSLVVGDFAAIEMRLVAYLANDPALTRAIALGLDIYCEFASAFYGRPITKADKAERWFGKTAILGLGYGMGAMKFQHTVRVQTGMQITDEEAERAVALYRTKYWRVPQLWDFLDRAIGRMEKKETGPLGSLPVKLDYGDIKLPSGLLIQYPGLRMKGRGRWGKPQWVYDIWGKKEQKEESRIYGGKILENIGQALAGELAKGVNQLFLDQLVGVCHDEVILCVPEETGAAYKFQLEAYMSQAPKWMPKLKLACEVGVGRNWNEAKA